jgi:hypothetical protein
VPILYFHTYFGHHIVWWHIQSGAKKACFQIIVTLFIFNVPLLHGYWTAPSALFSGGVGRSPTFTLPTTTHFKNIKKTCVFTTYFKNMRFFGAILYNKLIHRISLNSKQDTRWWQTVFRNISFPPPPQPDVHLNSIMTSPLNHLPYVAMIPRSVVC